MKIKLFSIVLAAGMTMLFSCQKNPQEKAEKIAEQEGQEAVQQVEKAESNIDKGMEHVDKAAVHATKEEMKKAIAAVPVPTFKDRIIPTEMAKKIGNHAIEFANSNDFSNAGKYADKIKADLEEVNKNVASGKFTQEEGKQIVEYAQNLAKAIGLTL